MSDSTLVAKLRAENARLVALLDAHGIEWQLPAEPVGMAVEEIKPSLSCPGLFLQWQSNQVAEPTLGHIVQSLQSVISQAMSTH